MRHTILNWSHCRKSRLSGHLGLCITPFFPSQGGAPRGSSLTLHSLFHFAELYPFTFWPVKNMSCVKNRPNLQDPQSSPLHSQEVRKASLVPSPPPRQNNLCQGHGPCSDAGKHSLTKLVIKYARCVLELFLRGVDSRNPPSSFLGRADGTAESFWMG